MARKQQDSSKDQKYDRTDRRDDDNNTSRKRSDGQRSAKGKKKGSRRRGHGRSDGGASDSEARRATAGSLSSLNDMSWYAKYPDILEAAGSIAYPYKPGMKRYIGLGNASKKVHYTVPGVMRITWMPSVGRSDSSIDPINICAREIYAKVRSNFSGALDVDTPDFIPYIMALDSIFAYIGALKRIYRTLTSYTPENYDLPEVLLQALGIYSSDIAVLMANKTVFWGQINQLIHMTRKFKLPAVMDVFNRHYWLNDNVYTDSATLQSQLFVFYQSAYYTIANMPTWSGFSWDETVKAQGAMLVMSPLDVGDVNALTAIDATKFASSDQNHLTKISHSKFNQKINDRLYDYGVWLIENLSDWDDSYTISGYLMRAYEGQPEFQVEPLSTEELLTPVYVPEVLTQIENIQTIERAGFTTEQSTQMTYCGLRDVDVAQQPSKNLVVTLPKAEYTLKGAEKNYAQVAASLNIPINVHSDAPTLADTVIATRAKTVLKEIYVPSTDETTAKWFEVISGTEIYTGMAIYLGPGNVINRLGLEPYNMSVGAASVLSAFDWHPICFAGSWNQLYPIGDIQNLTFIEPDILENLNRVCIYSEFNAFNQI